MAGENTEAVPADAPPQVTFKKRSAKAKTSLRKKAATPPPTGDSDSDFTSSDDDEGRRIKRRRKNATVTASSASNNLAAHRKADDENAVYTAAAPLVSSNDATKQSNWYDEGENNGLSAKELLGKTRATAATAPSADGTYRGTGNYQSFVRKNPDAPSKQFGPTKASTNVRTITLTDMAPDVCVDYKKSGFCGLFVFSPLEFQKCI
jgi:RING finger protein 113A